MVQKAKENIEHMILKGVIRKKIVEYDIGK